jgi:outer membrane protein TolC
VVVSLSRSGTTDVVAQEATLAQAQAVLPGLRRQLAQQRDLHARLAGRFLSEEPAVKFELSSLQLPQELPVSFPFAAGRGTLAYQLIGPLT